MTALLDDPTYIQFLADTHPAMRIRTAPLDVPSFTAPLDTREPLLPGLLRAAVSTAALVNPARVTPRSLFLGTPFERYDQSRLLSQVADPGALASAARRLAAREHLHTVVITNVSLDHPRLGEWLRAGFVTLPSFPDTVLDLSEDWNAQLSRLPQGDRSGIRRNIRRFERAGHTLERLHDSAGHADALWSAYKPMFDRAKVRWQPHTRAYFAGLAALHPHVHLTVARNAQRDVIGFVVAFDDPGEQGLAVSAGRIGIRADYHRRDAVYFRLMYHLVQQALQQGARTLSLEPTGYRMKRHLGTRPVALVNLVMGVSPTWRLALSTMAPVGRALLAHLGDLRKLEQEY